MLLTVNVKCLTNELFTVEIDDDCTVKDMKEKISEIKGAAFPAVHQKLIAQGRIMADHDKVKTYDLKSVKFVVIMVSKPNTPGPVPTAASTETTPAAAAASEAKPAESPKEVPKEAGTPTAARPSTTAPSADSSAGSESTLVVGEQYKQMVESITEMGYPQDQVERALRASFNNPDRAVEYLVTGFPPEEEEAQAAENPRAARQAGGGNEGDLAFLRNQPQFQQMRNAIRDNPALLDTIIQQLGSNNPDLLRLITQNQEDFMRLLNEEDDGAEGALPELGQGAPAGGPLVIEAHVTPQDREAIERLKALGFPEHLVVEAYFACDKNEDLAVNFLLQDD